VSDRQPLLTVRVRYEHDIVGARRRARQLAGAVGFDTPEQTRIATAVSELARNAFTYAGGGTIEYGLEGTLPPQLLTIRVSDRGPGIRDLATVLSGQYRSTTGMGLGLIGTRRLMDTFDIQSDGTGTTVTVKKILPRRAPALRGEAIARMLDRLQSDEPAGLIEEIQQQNQELLRTLEELRARQEELERVNRELEDTNRGVVALYAELDERADHLRRADELKTRFLSNMTHEFRTPVNSILALAKLLAERLGTSADQKDELFYIRKSAQQLSDLVDDLLDIAKVEAGKIEVRPAPFEIPALFGALRGMLRPLLVNQSVTLTFEEPAGLPPIYSDESKVSQILRNFISNALKYTERGEVRVSAALTPERDRIVFAVADTGIGIPAEDLDRVFDEFSQIENPLQRRVKGTGLGLPLSKRLAELLGGAVHVTSELGIGSTFSVAIPLIYRSAIRTVVEPPQPGRVPVLVIEDADEDLLLLEHALSATPFQSIPARSIAAAAAALEAIRPAAIVLDLRMQGEDSWDFLARLKRDESTAGIPVIIASTLDDRQKGLALGADAYGVKPIDTQWLLDTLNTLAGTRTPIRVVSVDDDEAHRFIVRKMLQGGGFEVRDASTGAEGLQLIREQNPDVVVLDVGLTDMSGFDVCDRLREDGATGRIPVILVTSQTLAAIDEPRFTNAAAVLSKSTLTRDALRGAIHSAIRNAQPQDARP
jgi:signal transduction histidine kinase/CheY-like chemotaxis protein